MSVVLDAGPASADPAGDGASGDRGGQTEGSPSEPGVEPGPRRLPRRPALDGLRGRGLPHGVPRSHPPAAHAAVRRGVDVHLLRHERIPESPPSWCPRPGGTERVSLRRFFGRQRRPAHPSRPGPARRGLVRGRCPVPPRLVDDQHAGWGLDRTDGPGRGGQGERWALSAYMTNWLDILQLYGEHASALGHLWFIAVQEQFYLLWLVPVPALLCSAGSAAWWSRSPWGWPPSRSSRRWKLTHGGANLVPGLRRDGHAGGRHPARRRPGRVVERGTPRLAATSRPRCHGRAAAVIGLVWTLVAFSTDHASTTDSLAWVVATLAGAALVVSTVVRQRGDHRPRAQPPRPRPPRVALLRPLPLALRVADLVRRAPASWG